VNAHKGTKLNRKRECARRDTGNMAGVGLRVFRFGDDCRENSCENFRENHGGHRDNYREKSGLKAISRLVRPSTWGWKPSTDTMQMALNVFKRKPPARRDVFSLDQQCSEIGTNSKIVVFFTGVQRNFDDQLKTPSRKLIFHFSASGLAFLTRPSP